MHRKILRYSGKLDQVLDRELTSTNLTRSSITRTGTPWHSPSSPGYPTLMYLRRVYRIAPPQPEDPGGRDQYLLRRAIKGLVPEPVRCRMDKMGFVTPEEVWMKFELRPFMLGVFTDT